MIVLESTHGHEYGHSWAMDSVPGITAVRPRIFYLISFIDSFSLNSTSL